MKKYLVLVIFSFVQIYAQLHSAESEKGTLNSYSYILKRVVNNTFDYFQMDKDNWRYVNFQGVNILPNGDFDLDNAILWPKAWWQNFNYSPPEYPVAWMFKKPSTFPDWALFVETFGTDYAYWNPPPGVIIYNPSATNTWLFGSGQWPGSCLGLAWSSLLAFSKEDQFKERFPALSSFNNLFDVSMSNEVRKVINLFWTIQWNRNYKNNYRDNKNKTPNETLSELRTGLTQANFDKTLILVNQNGSGGHAVVPMLIKEDANKATILIYDNNYYDIDSLVINKQINTWDYIINDAQWGGNKGLFLSESLSQYLTDIPSPKTWKKGETANDDVYLEIFSETDDDIIIRNLANQNEYIHFNPSDTSIINNFEAGIPLIPIAGKVTPPIGYYLPKNNLDIKVSSKSDSSTSILIVNNNLHYSYNRGDFENNQTDIIQIEENKLLLQNNDPVDKSINLALIQENEDHHKTYSITNTSLANNDLITTEIDAYNDLLMKNEGSSKSYNLEIVLQSSETEDIFQSYDITINQNSSQKIKADWDNLITKPVTILIDNNLDGNYDDSLTVNNQFTSVEPEDEQIPTEYGLNQNYPNPFNPSTNISFYLPKTGFTILSIYNLLGELVAKLVEQNLPAGYHQYTFEASNYPSGIYLYRLQSDNYTEVKKMIYLK